ncbi:MAG: TetR/AcrR family transcriptional regulator [Anaerolineae bacterium]|nr:TetR/AcrR family transcriptional regulator [Anaerolineae bacterium]
MSSQSTEATSAAPAQAIDRSTRRKLRTRARLLDAARRVIVARGFDATTIADITEAADLGKGTFYLHFTDKEDLTKALVLDGLEALAASIIAGRKDAPDPLTWRAEAVHAIFHYAHANRDLFHIMLGGGSSVQLTQAAREYAARTFEQVLREESEAGRDLPYPPELLAQIQTGAIVQTVIWWLEDPRGYSAEAMAEAVVNVLKWGHSRRTGLRRS